MKIKNYGNISLFIALGSWCIGIIFLLLSWWSVSLAYEGHQPGNTKPESLMLEIFPVLAFLALPGAIIAASLGIIALYKRQNQLKAIISILISIPLFLFLGLGYWAAANGGV